MLVVEYLYSTFKIQVMILVLVFQIYVDLGEILNCLGS